MNLFNQRITTLIFTLLISSLFQTKLTAQDSGKGKEGENTLKLVSDTSGYIDYSNENDNPTEVIPTIKGELNVNEQGLLAYTIPIEVFKGVNNFQPNMVLAYTSQSGIGQAGIGWNLVGLSSITIGGKNNRIDGTNEGVQYNGTDPYYLDGQRLIQVGSSNQYITEQYTQIKITKTDADHFKIQYTDGKVAEYTYKSLGQFLITKFQDEYGNSIFYTYTVITNVPYISSIKYGGSSNANSPFVISFSYLNRQVPLKTYRNGTLLNNSKFLNEIQVSSTIDGLHRKYIFSYDHTSTQAERLRRIEVENGLGDKLKPLIFNYNEEDGSIIISKNKKFAIGFHPKTNRLGSTAYGDFEGNGEISVVYNTVDALENNVFVKRLFHSKLGEISSSENGGENFQASISGKIIDENNQLSYNDRIVNYKLDQSTNEMLSYQNGYILNSKYETSAIDIKSTSLIQSAFDIPTGFRGDVIRCGNYDEDYCVEISPEYEMYKTTGDFNNDGLLDMFIFRPSSFLSIGSDDPTGTYVNETDVNEFLTTTQIPSRVYFLEIGKNISTTQNISATLVGENISVSSGSQIYSVEFDGDNVPELLIVNKQQKKFNVYKFSDNQLTPVLLNQNLNDFGDKTPLILGDFNGDGLTDFITPKNVYFLDQDHSVQDVVNSIKTETHKWWQYIGTGTGYIKTLRDFTNQKLAYCSPSQQIFVVDKSSGWQKFWSGEKLEYDYSEYAACGTLPVDFNNDGKTDLISFNKFGKIWYKNELKNSPVVNLTPGQNADVANKLMFFENVYDSSNSFNLNNQTQNQISLANERISPLSLIINTFESKGVEGQRANIKFFDPLLSQEINIDITSNEFLEGHIQEIDNSSGVKQQIEYAPLSTITKNGSDVTWSLYYKANPGELSLEYPYYVNKHQPGYLLVKRINTLFDNNAISKEYRYENAIQNFDGKGFQGFQKIRSSDPYESKEVNGEYLPKNPFEGVLWTISTYDPELENALIKTEYGSLDGEDILTSTENEYEKKEKANKQYTFVNTEVTAEDFLKGVTITKDYTYSEPNWLLEEVLTDFNGEATSTTSFEYKPAYSIGDHFFYGRITSNEQTISKGGETFTTKDEYEYPSQTLTIHKKYGNGTPPLITEKTFFANGNLKTEKVSGSGIVPLTTTYAYEATKRYVNKITAPDGLISQSIVNVLGQVESETSPFGLTTSYEYDNWGNKIKETDYLGIETNLVKEQLFNGQYSLSTEREGSPTSVVIFDRFDRPIITKTQSINNDWILRKTEYDVYGKKIKESEPYFQGESPTLWNEFFYDALDRVTEQDLYTGKVIITCYEGMTVTVEDGEQKTSKTLDVMGNVIQHVDMGGEINYDYYPNGTLKTANYDGITISVEQDGWGNKTSLTDPSAGTYTYEYDILGRLLLETTPKGETEYTYDNYGKLLTETSTGDETNITATYTYDATTKLPKKITGTSSGQTFEYETFYDQYYRVEGKKETHSAFVYETNSQFDTYGRLSNTTLSTTITNINQTTTSTIENVYESGSGILIEQRDVANNRRIWKIDEINQRGQTEEMNYGNGFTITNTYTNLFLPQTIFDQNTSTNQIALNIDYSFDPVKKRLNFRNLHEFDTDESFQYDELDRLVKEIVNGDITNQYTYDERGRMTYNTEVGTYEYNEENYQIKKFKFNENGDNLLGDRGFHQLKFNAFKQVVEIYLPGHDRINYDFNLFKKRAIAYYGSEDENKNNRPIRKYYTSDNAVEIIFDSSTNKTQVTTYVDGDPYSSSYIKVDKFTDSTLNSSQNYYLHRDYQGSIVAISNTDGRVVEQRYFDAWGNIKEVRHIAWIGSNSSTTTDTTLGIIDRGYTGHEHLQSVGLIHMNGRLYDSVVRRFLSPDNFVQDPYNTQNFDRYTYVYNNPLLYTDPSGEEITFGLAIVIAAVVSIVANGINNLINGTPFWYGMGKSATMGAVTGAISFGIGAVASSISGFAFQAGTQAIAHGVTGAIMSSIEGGNGNSGFAAGAISSLISSGVIKLGSVNWGGRALKSLGYGKYLNNEVVNAMTIASGGLSGGISSTIAGGNFWSGARQGLISSGVNLMSSSLIEKASTIANDKTKIKRSNRNDIREGDVISLHTQGDPLDLWAQQSKPQKGVVELHAHGSQNTIDGMRSVEDIGNLLYEKSPTWRSMINDHIEIELDLYSCSTGLGIAQDISKYYPRVTVKAPTNFWEVHYMQNKVTLDIIKLNYGSVVQPGKWVYFKNGIEINQPSTPINNH